MEWFFLILISIVVINVIATPLARRHIVLETSLSPDEVRAHIDRKFSKILWKRINGPGELNFRRRGPSFQGSRPPEYSIAFEKLPSGGSGVEMWMSAYTTRFGIVDGGPEIVLKGWNLARGLRGASSSRTAPPDRRSDSESLPKAGGESFPAVDLRSFPKQVDSEPFPKAANKTNNPPFPDTPTRH